MKKNFKFSYLDKSIKFREKPISPRVKMRENRVAKVNIILNLIDRHYSVKLACANLTVVHFVKLSFTIILCWL